MGGDFPGVEIRYCDVSISADIIVRDETQLLPTIANVVRTALFKANAKRHVVRMHILRQMSGVLKPGTMTLVLGQPGSGKSALMKFLSGRFPVARKIVMKGEVTYNGTEQQKLKSKLPQLVSYVGQSDEHYPTLTVKETLEFAHACSGGGLSERDDSQVVYGTSEANQDALEAARAINKHHPDIIIRQLGLENCQNTVVGDAMLRGVSGGERKRVTTGEMAFGDKFVMMMDEISTGLDSAATFDIISTQRSLAKTLNKTVVISLLQPSPVVFELFDDVILLNDGYVMYHGPRSEALTYFESLGFKCPPNRDVADFLLDLGSTKQRQYEAGSAPRTATEFCHAFEESDIQKRMLDYLHGDVGQKVKNFDMEAIPEFSQSFLAGAATLVRRQLKLTSRDGALLLSRLAMSLGLGLLNGSTFFQFDDTDSQLVMGLGYVVVCFVTMGQCAQVPTFIAARDVFSKQRKANFFRSSSFVLATSTSQIPIAVIETVIFGSIIYWMCGFAPTASAFLLFELIAFLTSMMLGAWFFCLAVVCPDLNVANPISVLSLLFFSIYSGFVITRGEIPSYLVWVYWISPMTWSVRAIVVNQYTSPEFNVCDYQGVNYCTKYNLTMGEYSLSAFDVQTERYWLWLGIAVLMVSYVVFMAMTWFMLEYWGHESPPNVTLATNIDTSDVSINTYALATTPKSKCTIDDISEQTAIQVPRIDQQPDTIFIPVTLAFKDLWYSVPDPVNSKQTIDLLKGVSGFALPGTITALMGSSGAGKTTLMDVIAGRKTGGKISGQILLNGHPATELAIRRATGYCEQMDIHSDASTFREALTFSAFLRQDADIPDSQKYDSVNECLDLLDLHPIADQIIRGSSTEQMKRLTIGVELAAQPSVLFLDEPTSGLDARSAKLIMDGVRKVADTGRTIVCTIHQPSAVVFRVFDSLLLLKRGGEMVYFGDLGINASKMVEYFEAIDGVKTLEMDSTPATWMLEVIGAGVDNDAGDKTDFVAAFKASEQYHNLMDTLERGGIGCPSVSMPALAFGKKRAATNTTQARFLIKRFFDLYWRTPSYNLTRLLVSGIVGVCFGITFLGGGYSSYQGINSGLGMSYMTTSFITYITFNAVLPITFRERASFYRERSAETYGAFWYFTGATLVEIPYSFVATFVFLAIYFPMVGFTGVEEFFAYWLHLTMLVLVLAYFGQLLAYTLPSIDVAAIFTVIVGSICTLFTGFNPPASSIPEGYRWLHQLVPHKHTFSGVTAIIFGDCRSDGNGSELGCRRMTNTPPSLAEGITVKEYLESVFQVDHSEIWSDFAFVIAWIVALRLSALLALQLVNHQKK